MACGIFGLLGLILLITSFALPQCDDSIDQCNHTDSIVLGMGSILLGTSILALLAYALYYFCVLKKQFNDLDNPAITQQPIIWRLDGEEWIRYLNYIYGPDRKWGQVDPLISFCCRQSSYDRVINRQFGHIILYWNGLIIDELYFISFRRYALQKIQLLNFNSHGQIKGLRIHTYFKDGKYSRDCYFDVFAPSSVSSEQLQIISQSYTGLMSGSTGYRLAVVGLHLIS
jgi:hypothetical protein